MRTLAFLSVVSLFSVGLAAPVTVFFGPFAWIQAQGGMPRVGQGQTLVPVKEGCDLLGLKCVADGATYRLNGQALKITHDSNGSVLLTPLKPLAAQAGQTVTWDVPSRTARVQGGQGTGGWRVVFGLDDRLNQEATFPHLTGPLGVTIGAMQRGVPGVELTLHAAQPLNELTLYAKTPGGLTSTGSRVRGSVDVPNRFPGCQGATTCTLPAPRDALWTLAYFTAP